MYIKGLSALYITCLPNEYLYQGKEYDEEHGINMYDFHARMYDPALGCWHVPDPMHQYASGYMAMGDNPVSVVDPSGTFDNKVDLYWASYFRAMALLYVSGGIWDDWCQRSFDKWFSVTIQREIMKNIQEQTENSGGGSSGGGGTPGEGGAGHGSGGGCIGGDVAENDSDVENSGMIEDSGTDEQSDEYSEYGKIIGGFNISGTLSSGGGVSVEFGYVVTDKRFAQYYLTIFAVGTVAAGLSGNLVIINSKGEFEPDISNWAGICWEMGGNYVYFVGQKGGDKANTYSTTTMGLGIGVSVPVKGTGAMYYGRTFLLGSPIDLNTPKDFFTNWYMHTGGY